MKLRSIGLTLALVLALPTLADAAPKQAQLSIQVVQASKKKGPTDPRVEPLRGELRDFAFKSYKLISERSIVVKEGASETVALPSGKKLTATFTKVEKNGRARLKLVVPGVVNTTVALAKGGLVILGGPAMPHGDGVLFVPVRLSSLE